MKKNLLLVQPNSVYGNSIYLPYAIGSLAAYAFADTRIQDNYEITGVIYKKESIETVAEKYKNTDIAAFSCYVWNYEYNKALAKKIKEINPESILIFGGHQINSESIASFDDIADFIILGEGDDSFKNILLALCGVRKPAEVPNIYIKNDGKLLFTYESPVHIPQRVSPYLTGMFDKIVNSEKELSFSSILETNRGCPNKCAFCDWGNIKARVVRFPQDLVQAEIDWFAINHIEYCYCADANFGLFKEDFATIEYLIQTKNKYGYPKKFQATYSKNNPDDVFELNKKLNNAGMAKGATLSFQSLSEGALENINRKNLKLASFRKLMRLYHDNGIATYSEIIIGLPGETLASFKSGVEELLDSGQHMSINFFNCELLANSPMNTSDYINKYKIEWVKCEQHQYHVKKQTTGIKEYSKIVVATNTMSRENWVACNIFVVFVRAFHNMGLLQCFAIFLHNEFGITYTKFYDSLITFAKDNPTSVCGGIYNYLIDAYKQVLTGEGTLTAYDKKFGAITWPFDEYSFLTAADRIDCFYNELIPFLKTFITDDALLNDLLQYQMAIVKLPGDKFKILNLNYDWFDYFDTIYSGDYKKPIKKKSTIKINCPDIPDTIIDYAVNVVWFGRKGGQNIYSDITYIEKGTDDQ